MKVTCAAMMVNSPALTSNRFQNTSADRPRTMPGASIGDSSTHHRKPLKRVCQRVSSTLPDSPSSSAIGTTNAATDSELPRHAMNRSRSSDRSTGSAMRSESGIQKKRYHLSVVPRQSVTLGGDRSLKDATIIRISGANMKIRNAPV